MKQETDLIRALEDVARRRHRRDPIFGPADCCPLLFRLSVRVDPLEGCLAEDQFQHHCSGA